MIEDHIANKKFLTDAPVIDMGLYIPCKNQLKIKLMVLYYEIGRLKGYIMICFAGNNIRKCPEKLRFRVCEPSWNDRKTRKIATVSTREIFYPCFP